MVLFECPNIRADPVHYTVDRGIALLWDCVELRHIDISGDSDAQQRVFAHLGMPCCVSSDAREQRGQYVAS